MPYSGKNQLSLPLIGLLYSQNVLSKTVSESLLIGEARPHFVNKKMGWKPIASVSSPFYLFFLQELFPKIF